AKKFPKVAQFPYLEGVALRNTGQAAQATAAFRRALAIDPNNSNAQLFLAQTFIDLGQSDSVVALANSAIAAGGDKSKWGPMLLAPVQDLMNKAKTDTANATQYYQRSLDLSLHADTVSSSPTTKFFIGVASLQLAVAAMQAAQPAKDCADAKRAQDMFTLSALNMPAGGSVDATTAAAVMTAIQKYSPIADQMAKAYCKKQ
ncbi:MAG TPA: tetratricopeptide repeat protein, partial [Gemmatimonadaceae bacterium]